MGPGRGHHRGPGRSTRGARPPRDRIRRRRVREPGAGRVRPCGRSRQGKTGVERWVSGMPGGFPGPSLGGPRVEGPTARRRDGPGPDRRSAMARIRAPTSGPGGSPAGLRCHADGDFPVPGRVRPSGRPDSANGGDRDHRGGPLLLGVDREYQVSYRDYPPQTWAFLGIGGGKIPAGSAIPPDPQGRVQKGPGRTTRGRPGFGPRADRAAGSRRSIVIADGVVGCHRRRVAAMGGGSIRRGRRVSRPSS